MVIQDILFPEKGICEETEMFCRGNVELGEKSIFFGKGKKCSLGTYFNSFSIGKWKTYTRISDLCLRLRFSPESDVEIKCLHSTATILNRIALYPREDGQVESNVKTDYEDCPIAVEKISNGAITEYCVHFLNLPNDGVLFVELEAISDSRLLGGHYETNCKEENSARIAIGICTFKREEAVRKNVHKIIDEVLNNPDSELRNDLEVFISDNGHTLSEKEFNSDKVHIFYNLNTGGSGGFTRTIIEAIYNYDGVPFNRIILMDDDITFSSEVLKRTYRLIKLLKKEYENAIIGGAMLLEEKRYVQNESGANVTEVFRLTPIKYKWDLRNKDLLAANELSCGETYNGWWYCCYSREAILNNDLPNPVFLHFDDVEYCHRLNKYGFILMNGINVWHPSFQGKAKIRTHYFDYRNCLVMQIGASSPVGKNELTKTLLYRSLRWLIRYQYDEMKLCSQAINDFTKGPSCLEERDQLGVLSKLGVIKEAEPIELSSLGIEEKDIYRGHEKNHLLQNISQLLKLIIPAQNAVRIVDVDSIWYPDMDRKVLCYDSGKKNGIVYTKNNREGFKRLVEMMKSICTLRVRYATMLKLWNEKKKNYTSIDFWEKYLGI